MKTPTKLVIGACISFSVLFSAASNSERPIQQDKHSNADYSARYIKNIDEVDKTVEPIITTETETSTHTIPYETVYQNDASMVAGTSRIATNGQNGEETHYYEVTYTDGKETDRKLIKTVTAKTPVNEVIVRGTKTCANGTYVNSAGNTVCRPSTVNTGGATAICRDGTYSYSQSRRGTCSHHGGVGRWL